MRINCHTHIFNLRSVFTKETLTILLNKLREKNWPPFAVKALEKLALKHIKGEMLTDDALAREFIEVVKADTALKGLIKRGEISLPANVAVALEGDTSELPVEVVKEVLGKLCDLVARNNDDDARSSDIGDYLEFLAIGLKPSILSVARLLIDSIDDDDSAIALTMDITSGGDADDELFSQQLKDTSQAVLAFPGRLFPFVAVNPMRTLHYERMTKALEEDGFVGVKLYPSLGYKIDSPAMRRVYGYCAEHDTPLLMHCTDEGFRRNKEDGQECNPIYWDALLEAFPKLRVCFGHFGGDKYLTKGATEQTEAESWTSTILTLMDKYEGRVFADIAFHDGPMRGGDAEKNYFENLSALLADSKIKNQILFGSDFPMVRQRLREQSYWRYFENRLSKSEFKQIAEINPVAFLGLPGPNGTGALENIQRHLRFLAKYNFEVRKQPAEWVFRALAGMKLGTITFHPNEFGHDWSSNNEAHFYVDRYFRDYHMNSEDRSSLTFADVGRMHLHELAHWPSRALPAELQQEQLHYIATRLQAYLTQAPTPAAVLEKDTTSAGARKALIQLFSTPDTCVAAVGPAVDTLYRFKSEAIPQ